MGVYIRSAFILSRNHLAKILSDPTPIPPNAAPDHQSKIFFNPVRLTTGKVPTGRGCRNCGGIGHKKDSCPNPRKEQKLRACFECGDPNHLIYDCPVRYRNERMRRLDSRFKQPINHTNHNRNSLSTDGNNHLQRHHNFNSTPGGNRSGPAQRRIQPTNQMTPRHSGTNLIPSPSTPQNSSQINHSIANLPVAQGFVSACSPPTKSTRRPKAMSEMGCQTSRDDYDPKKPKEDDKEKDGNLDVSVTEGGSDRDRNASGQREKKVRLKNRHSPSVEQPEPSVQPFNEIHPLLQKLLITPTKPDLPTFGTINTSSAKQLFNTQMGQQPQVPQPSPAPQRPPQQHQNPFSFITDFGSSLGHIIPPAPLNTNQTNHNFNNIMTPSVPRQPAPQPAMQPVPVSSFPPMLDVLFNRHPSPSSVITTPPRHHQQSDLHLSTNRNSGQQPQAMSPFTGLQPSNFPKLPGQTSPVKSVSTPSNSDGSSKSTLDSFPSLSESVNTIVTSAPPGFNKIVATGARGQTAMGPGRYRPPGSVGPSTSPNGPGISTVPTSVARGRGRGINRNGS